MILNQKTEYNGRTRRPPRSGKCHVVLCLFYIVRSGQCTRSSRLDAYAVYAYDRGENILSFGYCEELRAPFDRFVLALINTNQISKDDFVYQDNGQY